MNGPYGLNQTSFQRMAPLDRSAETAREVFAAVAPATVGASTSATVGAAPALGGSVLAQADTDASGGLSRAEFDRLTASAFQRSGFEHADLDRNGTVDAAELATRRLLWQAVAIRLDAPADRSPSVRLLA